MCADWETGGRTFPYPQAQILDPSLCQCLSCKYIRTLTFENFCQGTGRCANANCKTDPPPDSGVRELEAGETWCDTIVNFGGQVFEMPEAGLLCSTQEGAAGIPCNDLGKAWYVTAIQ